MAGDEHLQELGLGLEPLSQGIVRQVREIKVLSDCQATILSERRKFAPYGLAGGKPGQNYLVTLQGRKKRLPSKVSLSLKAGEKIGLAAPGDGGWG